MQMGEDYRPHLLSEVGGGEDPEDLWRNLVNRLAKSPHRGGGPGWDLSLAPNKSRGAGVHKSN
jgi:hypothetical protein